MLFFFSKNHAERRAVRVDSSLPKSWDMSRHRFIALAGIALLPWSAGQDIGRCQGVVQGVERVREVTASWYGPGFEGNLTANQEIFDPGAMTCAHRSLPFGSIVEMENPENGASVRVRVNDRGPFIAGREFDLSHAAAVELGFESKGLARLRFRVLGEGEGAATRGAR